MGIVDWEPCIPGRPRSRWNRPEGTMRPNGDILFTRATWELMGEPEQVLIFYSRRAETIGIKPVNGKIRDVFRVEPKSSHGKHGGRIVRAASLIEQFHIKLANVIRFNNAEIDRDGILTLDLTTATRPTAATGSFSRSPRNYFVSERMLITAMRLDPDFLLPNVDVCHHEPILSAKQKSYFFGDSVGGGGGFLATIALAREI